MRFFSKVVAVCNVCFILAALFRYIEMRRRGNGNYNGVISFQPLEATIVVLGYGAILVNAIFLMLYLIFYRTGPVKSVSKKILLFNLIIFGFQVYYFFFL